MCNDRAVLFNLIFNVILAVLLTTIFYFFVFYFQIVLIYLFNFPLIYNYEIDVYLLVLHKLYNFWSLIKPSLYIINWRRTTGHKFPIQRETFSSPTPPFHPLPFATPLFRYNSWMINTGAFGHINPPLKHPAHTY